MPASRAPQPSSSPSASSSGPNWPLLWRRWHANLGMLSAITLGIVAISCFTIAHKAEGGIAHVLKAMHTGKFLPEDWRWLWIDSQGFLLGWLILSGWWIHHKSRKRGQGKVTVDAPHACLVLYDGTHPRAHRLAHELSRRLTAAKASSTLMRAEDHSRVEWSRLSQMAWIRSEGTASSLALDQFLRSRKAPRLKGTRAALLCLESAPSAVPTSVPEIPGVSWLVPPSRVFQDEDSVAFAWMDQVVQQVAPAAPASAPSPPAQLSSPLVTPSS